MAMMVMKARWRTVLVEKTVLGQADGVRVER
jgi:hypothetical protein